MTCYMRFCEAYSLPPFPCSASQAAFYVAYLSEFMSPSSIRNYLSAVWAHQRSLGMQTYLDDYALRLTLRGVRRLGNASRPPRHPLSTQELLAMFDEINTLLPWDLVFWAAVTLAFRALLRKSHYTPSPHILQWKDLSIYPDYLVLVLPSSKTDQFSERPLRIVLNSSPGSPLCPVFWLSELARVQRPLETDFIFRTPSALGYQPLDYCWFNSKLKYLASVIGLDPSCVSSHSLRHGGASFMSAKGSEMLDIRARGSWASSAIYNYLHHSVSTLRTKDSVVSSSLP